MTWCASPNREPGVAIEHDAKDFGIHPMTLQKWLKCANVEDDAKPGTTASRLRNCAKRGSRSRLREQENEISRRAAAYLSQVYLPGE